jgi:hypothetical protein
MLIILVDTMLILQLILELHFQVPIERLESTLVPSAHLGHLFNYQ